MNEIHVRTNKGEYNPGEDVYGVVYLRIVSPTSGRGVRISFHGKEKIEYLYKTVDEGQPNSYEDNRDYICHRNIVLYESDEPLMIGNWLYPFRIHLPTDIPGSFSVTRDNKEITWEANVDYILQVAVIGASQGLSSGLNVIVQQQSTTRSIITTELPEAVSCSHELAWLKLFSQEITVTARYQAPVSPNFLPYELYIDIFIGQSVVIHQTPRCKCPRNTSPVAVHVTQPIRGFFFTHHLHLVARLHEHIHRAGSNLRLRVIVTNKTSTEIQSLHIKLMRKMRLISKKQQIRDDPNVTRYEDHGERLIFNVDDSSVVEEQDISMKNFQKGLDQIQIPLKNKNGHPIYPTVRGMHVRCEYHVCLTVLLSNGSTFDLTVPVPVILSQVNKEWTRWMAPTWISNDFLQIQHSESLFGVPENVLSSECFSNLPGFQPL